MIKEKAWAAFLYQARSGLARASFQYLCLRQKLNTFFPTRAVQSDHVEARNFQKLQVNCRSLKAADSHSQPLQPKATSDLLSLYRSVDYFFDIMADALKAEGNKAFSAKDYATAMYVPRFAVD